MCKARWLFILSFFFLLASPSVVGAEDWSDPVQLASGEGIDAPCMALDSQGRLHLVWSEGGMLYQRVFDQGWSEPMAIAEGHSPCLVAASEGRLFMAFVALAEGGTDVFVASWDPKTGWGLPVNVSNSERDSTSPDLAISSQEALAVVWEEDGRTIYFAQSADGLLWSTVPVPQARGRHPQVTFEEGDVPMVAWVDEFDEGLPGDVFVSQRTVEGWSLPVDVSYSPTEDSEAPALATGPEGVVLLWEEGEEGGWCIYGALFNGQDWSAAAKCSPVGAHTPQLAFDAVGHGHALWALGEDVQHRSWTHWEAFAPSETLEAGGTVGQVALAASKAVHVVWTIPGADATLLYYSVRGQEASLEYKLCLPLVLAR